MISDLLGLSPVREGRGGERRGEEGRGGEREERDDCNRRNGLSAGVCVCVCLCGLYMCVCLYQAHEIRTGAGREGKSVLLGLAMRGPCLLLAPSVMGECGSESMTTMADWRLLRPTDQTDDRLRLGHQS
ncbi:hypothetical protein IE53DRAFT_172601 [Violaceomyces palustris]|uniref:Uncharacterized protein n=1 Tax=Violaceomyces palustris TaxID=1673888 RepID=A0ACD0NT34_9BASI|nr:hypothetical protein IE53DRAFT_172601 [Violaceomyces palustris]